MLPSPVCEGQVAFAIRRERDPVAIRRPRRSEVATGAGSERGCAPRLKIQRPEIRRSTRACADEYELLPVRRKRRLIVVRRIVVQALDAAAIRLHTKQICRAVA